MDEIDRNLARIRAALLSEPQQTTKLDGPITLASIMANDTELPIQPVEEPFDELTIARIDDPQMKLRTTISEVRPLNGFAPAESSTGSPAVVTDDGDQQEPGIPAGFVDTDHVLEREAEAEAAAVDKGDVEVSKTSGFGRLLWARISSLIGLRR